MVNLLNRLLSKKGALSSLATPMAVKQRGTSQRAAVKRNKGWKRFTRRMRRDADKGSAALEFAFIAPIFFLLLMGTIEAALIFFAQTILQNAVTETGRMVRTGQVQGAGTSQSQFRTQICDAISPLMSCDSNLQIDVESFGAYGNVNYADPLNADGTMTTGLNNYSTGSPCSVVLVRAFYSWQVFSPGLNWFLVNMAGDKHLLSAASAFRNEPYTNAVAGC